MITVMSVTLVAIGGAIGSALRYIFSVFAGKIYGPDFPYGTLGVNIIGSLLMGILIGVLARYFSHLKELHLLLAVGFLGGFTTFSAFSLDVFTLFERGDVQAAIFYIIYSLVGALGGLAIGIIATRAVL